VTLVEATPAATAVQSTGIDRSTIVLYVMIGLAAVGLVLVGVFARKR
jgi:hypothetical protein